MPSFFSDSNIVSISTFMQNMKIFLKLFSKIRCKKKKKKKKMLYQELQITKEYIFV